MLLPANKRKHYTSIGKKFSYPTDKFYFGPPIAQKRCCNTSYQDCIVTNLYLSHTNPMSASPIAAGHTLFAMGTQVNTASF